MKYLILGGVGLVVLAVVAIFGYVIADAIKNPAVRCFVIANNASAYTGPGIEFGVAHRNVHGMVDVVGKKGDWWKLADGSYMRGIHLTPTHVGEYPKELKK